LKQVAFRLDQPMVDAVADRIERDGITLSGLMRKALRAELQKRPDGSIAELKLAVFRQADEPTIRKFTKRFEAAWTAMMTDLFGDLLTPAIPGAPVTEGRGWTYCLKGQSYSPDEPLPPDDGECVKL
jgi:hypothetical protein